MAQITLDQARAGMVLAAGVYDRRGRLLMPCARELNEGNLTAFRMWGVSTLEIVGEQPEAPREPELDEGTLARADEHVARLFVNAGPAHPFLDELRKVARLRRARSLARAEAVT
jgi:hypothetical protein